MKYPALLSATLIFSTSFVLSEAQANSALYADLEPHRAVYEMTLDSRNSGSHLSDVAGIMAYQWGNGCDGWVMDQQLNLTLSFRDGETSQRVTSYSTWENEEGSSFKYRTSEFADDEVIVEMFGEADYEQGVGGTADLKTQIGEMDIPLPIDTYFPSRHMAALLQHAREGDKFFTANFFDGSDLKGVRQASALILPAKTEVAVGLQSNGLVQGERWKVTLSMYQIADATPEPDYEMRFIVNNKGIIEDFLIEYKSYSVKASLVDVEEWAQPDCSVFDGKR